MNYSLFLFSLLQSLSIGLLATPAFIRLARRRHIVDVPAHRKIHTKPVAYLGGASIFAAILATLMLLRFFPPSSLLYSEDVRKVAAILGVSSAMAALGLWDDMFPLRARYKLIGQLALCLLFTLFGYRFDVAHIPGFSSFPLAFLSIPFTVFWMLVMINAINLVDGMDGLAGSVLAGALLLTAAASALTDNPGEVILSLAAFGGIVGFLAYNWSPAKIYLGDSGSNGLGMLLACLWVALGHREVHVLGPHPAAGSETFPYQIFVASLVATYPSLEILLSVSRRLLRGRPISRADKNHIHHRLRRLGWSSPSVCLSALGTNLLPGLAGLAILAHEYGKAAWLLAFSGLFLGYAMSSLGILDFLRPANIATNRPHFLIANYFINMQRQKLGLAHGLEEVLALLNQTCTEFGVLRYWVKLAADPLNGDKPANSWSWALDRDDHRKYLTHLGSGALPGDAKQFQDVTTLRAGKASAGWVFVPSAGEGDLEVEYHVLISEFMAEALNRMVDLQDSLPAAEESNIQINHGSHIKMRSCLLCHRHLKAVLKAGKLEVFS